MHTYRKTPLGLDRKILIEPGACEVTFSSDKRLLGRVIGNLVKNALEASPVGGTVTLSCAVKEEGICFWLNNSGVIPLETQLQIFNRSYSTKEPGEELVPTASKYSRNFISKDA